MSNRQWNAFSREAVGVFASADAMQAAIDELLSSGFDRAEVNLLAGEHAVREKLGHLYRKTTEAEDDPEAPRTAYVSPESIGDAEGGVIGALMYVPATLAAGTVVASGGTLAAAVGATALALGAGALAGSALAGLIGDHHAKFLHDQMEKGGLLLWVLTRTPEREARAVEILSRHSGRDVHVHGERGRHGEGGRAMKDLFERALENLIEEYLAQGMDAQDLVDALTRQRNLVIGRHNLEYDLDVAVGQ